jgi:hypothetical protein
MAKQFVTERDIEDMARRGELSIILTDSTVLTELAYEKAERLGVKLIQPHQLPPSAPIRPYLSEIKPVKKECANCAEPSGVNEDDIKKRIRDAVKAKLGNQVDGTLLETIISRVLNNVGVK